MLRRRECFNTRHRNSIEYLACEGLGWCCLWAFFKANPVRTGLLADRLGVTSRAIRYRKLEFKHGELACEECEGCKKDLIDKSSEVMK